MCTAAPASPRPGQESTVVQRLVRVDQKPLLPAGKDYFDAFANSPENNQRQVFRFFLQLDRSVFRVPAAGV